MSENCPSQDSVEDEQFEKEQLCLNNALFKELENDFQEVLKELFGDSSLDKFRVEYEKLHTTLVNSHENEIRLMQKCRELNAELIGNTTKVADAMRIAKNDQETISSLKMEIEKAWKIVDAAQQREIDSRVLIKNLEDEISDLSHQIEESGMAVGQRVNVTDLINVKTDLINERDGLLTQIGDLRKNEGKIRLANETLEKRILEVQEESNELRQDLRNAETELQNEKRRKEKTERVLLEKIETLNDQEKEIKELQTEIETSKANLKVKEQLVNDQKLTHDQLKNESEIMHTRYKKLHQESETQLVMLEKLSAENSYKNTTLKQLTDEMTGLKAEFNKIRKNRDNVCRKLQNLEKEKEEVEASKAPLKYQISTMEKEIIEHKKKLDSEKKFIDDVTKEREILKKNLIKSNTSLEKYASLVQIHDKRKRSLEQEVEVYREEANKQRKIIFQLEKERDRYINEASDLTQKVLTQMEEIKMKEMQIFDYKKMIAEGEVKLKQQKNLYEAVRSDRNLYSKNLIESQDEISEMKRKLKIMNHQIDQLKEMITFKEQALIAEHNNYVRIEKEKEAQKIQLQKLKDTLNENKVIIEEQEIEEARLQKIINEADSEYLRQKKELDQVISERDILGSQLVRRNDELALLYEKIKIQSSTLQKGEVQYTQRVEDIRVLKLEIMRLRSEQITFKKTLSNYDEIRNEVFVLQKQLVMEKNRARVLEEELDKPLNVHRWRKLEGSDPAAFEMIKKVQSLQVRLIKKTEEVVCKEQQIREKEKLYLELKKVLARQPGPEMVEQVQLYQRSLKEKSKQLKSLTGELNMYESQVQEYKYDIDKLGMELQTIKKKYYSQRKKEQEEKEKETLIARMSNKNNIMPQINERAKFVGGGFSMNPQRSTAATH